MIQVHLFLCASAAHTNSLLLQLAVAFQVTVCATHCAIYFATIPIISITVIIVLAFSITLNVFKLDLITQLTSLLHELTDIRRGQ